MTYLYNKAFFSLLLVLAVSHSLFSQKIAWKKSTTPSLAFEENNGQLSDEKGSPVPGIKYYGRDRGVALYCFKDHLSFVFERTVNKRIEAERLEMHFFNANPVSELVPDSKQRTYNNYYNEDNPNGILKVYSFKKLTYKDIYQNIDLVLEVNEKPLNGLEYSFIVHPGGNLNDIVIQWSGMDEMKKLENGGIHYSNKLGELNESEALAYMGDEKKTSQVLKTCEVSLYGNTLRFHVEKYDHTKTLIIDPTLSWSTYYGGRSGDAINSIHAAVHNKIFVTGYTYSRNAIASAGVFQDIIGDSVNGNAFIAYFDSSGRRIWGTYYGSKRAHVGLSITSDSLMNSYVIGRTTDSNTFCATKGAYQAKGHRTYYDAFIAKFDSSGKRVWGTYYGGSDRDNANSIITDMKSKIFIGGSTNSSDNLTTPGSYLYNKPGGARASASFLACFDTSGKILWGTYYPNSGIGKICLDKWGHIFFAGGTGSSTSIATKGVFQPNYNKLIDGFVVKLDSNGKSRLWGTYYGGEMDDNITGLSTDKWGNVFLAGTTASNLNIASSAYSKTGGTSFAAKLDSSGKRIWGKYISGAATALVADSIGYSFLSGSGYSTVSSGLYFEAEGIDSSGKDRWERLNSSNNGESVNTIDMAKNGDIYIAGETSSDSGISTSGSWQPKYGGSHPTSGTQNDGFITKINGIYCPSPKVQGLTGLCIGQSGIYSTLKFPGNTYYWKGIGCHITGGQGTDSVTVDWDSAGYGYVRVTETNPSVGCSVSNEMQIVGNELLSVDFTFNNACLGQPIHFKLKPKGFLGIWGNNTKYWDFGDGSSDTSMNPTHVYIKTGSFTPYFRAREHCSASKFKVLNVSPLPSAEWGILSLSAGNITLYPLDSNANNTYLWHFGDGDSSALSSPTHQYNKDTLYTISLQITDSNGCTSKHDSTIRILRTGVEMIKGAGLSLSIHPNPFNETTTINYLVPNAAKISISIYDLTGRIITTLLDAEQNHGENSFTFQASKYNLSPGLYILKLQIGVAIYTRKLVKLAN
jgi:hypothetical protein